MSLLLLGRGHVYHSRKVGGKNSFKYPHFFLQFRIDEEMPLKNFFKTVFFNCLSIQGKDYLLGGGESLGTEIKNFLRTRCEYAADEVWLHTVPRVFGYAFNPVNFWLCKKSGALDAVLVEVNNTFGERHFYWISKIIDLPDSAWIRAEKVFHVSPFFPVDGFYQFRFQLQEHKTRIDINYHGSDDHLRLATWVDGRLSPVQDISLLHLLKNYGWITILVILRIHYQALRLYFKKNRFYRKPSLPKQEITS